MNAAPSLKRLPLAAFPPPGQPTSDRDGAAAAAQRPAQLTRATVRLVFATRAHVSKLAAVEQELLRAAGKDARDPPSVLRGAVVRYMSQGRHRLDLVAGTAVDAQGALALRLAAFCKLVPVACLSASSPLDDDAAWEGGGGKEVAELAQALASRLPTCSEVATACCRLSLGWLWAGQLGAVKAAAQADLAGVAALLDDGVAVAAVLPCVVPPMSLPATLQKPAAAAQPKPALASPPQQQHEQEQQMPRMLAKHNKNWRTEFRAGSVKLTELVLALQRRGYVQAEQHLTTKGTKQPPAGSGQLRKAREHMPPGGALEALLLQLVADADRAEPGCWHTIGALGTMIGKHNSQWKSLAIPSATGVPKLQRLVTVLQERGHVEAEDPPQESPSGMHPAEPLEPAIPSPLVPAPEDGMASGVEVQSVLACDAADRAPGLPEPGSEDEMAASDATGRGGPAPTRRPPSAQPSASQGAQLFNWEQQWYPLGLLWVWMDPKSAAAAALRPLPLPTELQPTLGGSEASGVLLGDWYQRDLPVSAPHLLENLLDPSHVHWAHHGVIGRGTWAGPISLEQEAPITAQGGFTMRMQGQWSGRSSSGQQEAAVHRVLETEVWGDSMRDAERLNGSGANGSGANGSGANSSGGGARPVASPAAGAAAAAASGGTPAATHFVPPGLVWPDQSRLFAGYSTDALPPAARSLLQSGRLTPLLHAFQFLGDLGAHEVVDGDLIHIFRQARLGLCDQEGDEQGLRRSGESWRQAYFMPAAADRGVLLLRRWLDELAGGGPRYGLAEPGAPPPQQLVSLSRMQILDRWEQHTRVCPSCSRALSGVRTARAVLQVGATSGLAAALAVALLRALMPAPPLPSAPGSRAVAGPSLVLLLGAAALAAGVLQLALGSLELRFIGRDYRHDDK
ncbi:Pheophorbide a oxygenase [Micractinium conductrix]|uniref:Pheophorbide a oxygenase n=1 Tax=Micractinium conductrix TaxID=554055 RepID=A0A2P6VMG3_9CHLO|nr:Pheophorbide a oxygenase [Micractinium conductrix]|eukprot:PSC75292.1 Pheophorbide a oxygenase [Micractinium conductrix]